MTTRMEFELDYTQPQTKEIYRQAIARGTAAGKQPSQLPASREWLDTGRWCVQGPGVNVFNPRGLLAKLGLSTVGDTLRLRPVR